MDIFTPEILNWTFHSSQENLTSLIVNETEPRNYTQPHLPDDILYHPISKAIFYALYFFIFFIGLIGNAMVCWIVLRSKGMQTVTNYFILSLAFADILLVLLAVPFTPIYSFLQYWPFGKVFCHMVPFSQGTSVYISTLTLTAIAIDRYTVIIYPFKPRMRISTCFCIIMSIWVASMLATSPYGIFINYENDNGTAICIEMWPSESFRHIFSLVTVSLQFFIPVIIITACYIRISVRLSDRAKLKPGAKSSKKEAMEKDRKRKTNFMLISMVCIFVASWLPINTFNLLNDFVLDREKEWQFANLAFFISHAIAMSSTIYNPFLYSWLNEVFRKEFKQILPCFRNSGNNNGFHQYKQSNRSRRLQSCNGGGGGNGGGGVGNENIQETLITRDNITEINQNKKNVEPGAVSESADKLQTIGEIVDDKSKFSSENPSCQQDPALVSDQFQAKYSSKTDQVEIQIHNNNNNNGGGGKKGSSPETSSKKNNNNSSNECKEDQFPESTLLL